MNQLSRTNSATSTATATATATTAATATATAPGTSAVPSSSSPAVASTVATAPDAPRGKGTTQLAMAEDRETVDAYRHEGLGARAPFRATSLHAFQASTQVEGEIPAWLRGDLLRTAPAGFQTEHWSAAHWFDGLCMLYQFRIGERDVTFSQRLLESDATRKLARGQLDAGSFATPMKRRFLQRLFQPIPQMTDNTNVNVVPYGDQRVAMTETCHQLVIDPATLGTTSRIKWSDREGSVATIAHPHFDFERKVIVNAALVLGGASPHVLFYEHGPSERTRRPIARVHRSRLPYVHAFGLTPRHLVLIEHPYTVKPMTMLWSEQGLANHFRWFDEQGTTLTRIDRASGREERFAAPAGFVFHVINAFEEADATIMDVVVHHGDVVDGLAANRLLERGTDLGGKHLRWVMRSGTSHVEEICLSSTRHEFPNVDYARRSGRPYRRSWGSATALGPQQSASAIVGFDLRNAATTRFEDPGYVIGEPVFVGRKDASSEDEGVLLAVGASTEHDESRLYVLRADSLEPQAVARVSTTVPLGFHGSFFRANN